MFIDRFPKLREEQVRSVEWKDDPELYDIELQELIGPYALCFVLNPEVEVKVAYYITEIPENQGECIIWTYRDQWVAKLFYEDWTPETGYIEIDIQPPQLMWRKNPDIDQSMTFIESPFGNFEPEPWDIDYTMVWYVDPQFNPSEDKVWVMSCDVLGKQSLGIKEMGFLIPEVEVSLNPDVPYDGVDLDGALPPYWDLAYECAYYLDPSHCGGAEEEVWLVKVKPTYRQTKGWKWLGSITPEPQLIYNDQLGEINFEVDFSNIHFQDFAYENIYYLDRKHLPEASDDVWAVKVKFIDQPEGYTVVGNISPTFTIEFNPDMPDIEFDISMVNQYDMQLDEFDSVLTWYISPNFTKNKRVWLAKKYIKQTGQEKFMGYIRPDINEDYDVFFISYDEPNADENYERLLSKCPAAKRIKGITGILEAHKKAASLAKTSMFYVVDADCYIDNKFEFDFQPSVWDLDCVYVWHSKNPFNSSEYGYGGVKLFPTQLVKEAETWTTDLTTSIGPKLKVIPLVSNETRFNTSSFHTWRSVFREVVKLSFKNDAESQKRMRAWANVNFDADHADWAARAVEDAQSWAMKQKNIKQINDYNFLENYFKKLYPFKNVGHRSSKNTKSNTNN
ncbi:hypothetical protein EB118_19370 [bacterium]|nr:hypothetical protein [Synechococcaceae bacterium WB6_1A_059]NDG32224.1 hypothetical protein [bacterium]NDG79107.1 hypothetical protein [Synechococcaceae bacterium WB8_1B_057]